MTNDQIKMLDKFSTNLVEASDNLYEANRALLRTSPQSTQKLANCNLKLHKAKQSLASEIELFDEFMKSISTKDDGLMVVHRYANSLRHII